MVVKKQKKNIKLAAPASVLHADAKEPSPRVESQLDDSAQMPARTQISYCVYQ